MPIELVNNQKDQDESGLRLVDEQKMTTRFPELEKQFVSFMFFKVDPDWRRLDPETKRAMKEEFIAEYSIFSDNFLLFSYSLVGFDSKADLMLWRIGNSMDLLQEMTAKLYRTDFGSFLETTDNYMSVTKQMMFVTDSQEDRFYVNAGEKKYHFLYPCAKEIGWFQKSPDERDALIHENFMVGKKFPNIKIHLTHSFGFSESDYLISFETDEPKDFLALAEELRQTTASKFTMRGMPIYTCRKRSLLECLDALG